MESSSSKKSHSGKSNIFAQYIVNTVVFVAVALIIAVAAILIINKPVTQVVHKVEQAAGRSVGDIAVVDEPDKDAVMDYGYRIGSIVCKEKGINCNVYYGLNRACCRKGIGYSSDSPYFGEKGNTVLAGYDETYLAGLKLVEKGDLITFTSDEMSVTYKVADSFIDEKKSSRVNSSDSDTLVMYSMYSEFSDNSGKCFYVIADKVSEEVKK